MNMNKVLRFSFQGCRDSLDCKFVVVSTMQIIDRVNEKQQKQFEMASASGRVEK